MEERRLLIATALCFVVFSLYPLLFPQAVRPVVKPSPAPVTAVRRPDVPAADTLPAETAPIVTAPVAAAAVQDDQERRVEIANADVTAAFTNRGARLVSWTLGGYRDVRGRPEEMVQAAPGGLKPLDLETGDPRLDARLREALFRASAETLRVGSATEELKFEFAGDGLEVVKRFWFEPRGYQPPDAAILAEGGVERVAADKLTSARVVSGVRWLGVESRYFAALFVPGAGSIGDLRSVPAASEGSKPRVAVAVALGGHPVGLYVGPKDYHELAGHAEGLEQVVPVGEWIGGIVIGFMRILGWLRGQVGSYGLAIISLTVLINVVMAPLRHYSIANGVRMAKLSPEMKVIQERYKKFPALDPRRQEMQAEISALYARHGMSMGTQMAVGCVPLLLTFPFLIAMYRLLDVSIDLRGSAFLWMPDLSQKDPLFITPVVMGLSMFVMQRMTPTAMDAAQQRVMTIMPLMFTVMFFAAPAGMNLYWLSSNLCSILQQGVTLRILRQQDGRREKIKA